jgi:hypothetical protein
MAGENTGSSVLTTPPGDEEEKKTAVPGENLTGNTLGSEFDWRTRFRTEALGYATKLGKSWGIPDFTMEAFIRDNIDGALNAMRAGMTRTQVEFDLKEGIGRQIPRERPLSIREWDRAWKDGLMFLSVKSGLPFYDPPTAPGGGGSGSRRPTAAQLRQSFDEDQLTKAVEEYWGAYLLEDAPNARAVARGYIDAVVATGGEQEMDFETFVVGKIEQTSRFRQLYANKPEGKTPLEYITPYTNMASQVLGGSAGNKKQLGSIVAGGAALGSSPDAFAERLQRTDAVKDSSGFIRNLEDSVAEVRGVLRG